LNLSLTDYKLKIGLFKDSVVCSSRLFYSCTLRSVISALPRGIGCIRRPF